MGVLVGRMTRKRSESMPFFGLRWFLVVAMRPRWGSKRTVASPMV